MAAHRRTTFIQRSRPRLRARRTDDKLLVFDQEVLAAAVAFQRQILIDTWQRFRPPGRVKDVPPDVMETLSGIVFGVMSGEELALYHAERKELRARLVSRIAEVVLSA